MQCIHNCLRYPDLLQVLATNRLVFWNRFTINYWLRNELDVLAMDNRPYVPWSKPNEEQFDQGHPFHWCLLKDCKWWSPVRCAGFVLNNLSWDRMNWSSRFIQSDRFSWISISNESSNHFFVIFESWIWVTSKHCGDNQWCNLKKWNWNRFKLISHYMVIIWITVILRSKISRELETVAYVFISDLAPAIKSSSLEGFWNRQLR